MTDWVEESAMGMGSPLREPLRKRESSLWQREANDWYQEPSWCSLRLFEEEAFRGAMLAPADGSKVTA